MKRWKQRCLWTFVAVLGCGVFAAEIICVLESSHAREIQRHFQELLSPEPRQQPMVQLAVQLGAGTMNVPDLMEALRKLSFEQRNFMLYHWEDAAKVARHEIPVPTIRGDYQAATGGLRIGFELGLGLAVIVALGHLIVWLAAHFYERHCCSPSRS